MAAKKTQKSQFSYLLARNYNLASKYAVYYEYAVYGKYAVYYVAVRTVVLSRHGSNLARPVIIHDIIHCLIYVPSTPCCGFFGVSWLKSYKNIHSRHK